MGPLQRPPGERPRTHFGRGPGRLRQGALTLEVTHVPEGTAIRPGVAGDAVLSWSWRDIVEKQRAGIDALQNWRARLSASTARQYATVVPDSMPAAFVLQWTLEAAAETGVHAARHHPWIVHPFEAGLSFQLQPSQLYPVAAQFERPRVTPALLDDRLDAARAAYRADALELALGYHSPVRLGEHTRRAMVDDVWAMTLARARGQRPPERGSCCFIYVLPGVHECSGCPRVAPGTAGGT